MVAAMKSATEIPRVAEMRWTWHATGNTEE